MGLGLSPELLLRHTVVTRNNATSVAVLPRYTLHWYLGNYREGIYYLPIFVTTLPSAVRYRYLLECEADLKPYFP